VRVFLEFSSSFFSFFLFLFFFFFAHQLLSCRFVPHGRLDVVVVVVAQQALPFRVAVLQSIANLRRWADSSRWRRPELVGIAVVVIHVVSKLLRLLPLRLRVRVLFVVIEMKNRLFNFRGQVGFKLSEHIFVREICDFVLAELFHGLARRWSAASKFPE
tara:strand:- start:4 stop:480 length:477 start_codon:yes stop_codon:yes gene_type:complete